MSAAAKNQWFEVDKEGLSQLVERRGKAFVLFELIQNAWDCSGVTRVEAQFTYLGRDRVEVTVHDDHPDGFANLAHAFTLFAPSEKKGDPGRRGRFNLGEKLVLSICDRARVTSTKGTVVFERDGRRIQTRARSKTGTVFNAIVRMSRSELEDLLVAAGQLIVPLGVRTFVNGQEIGKVEALHVISDVPLLTEVAGPGGRLVRRFLTTNVHLYPKRVGEEPQLYELGIPVMKLDDDPFHVDVRQKVPLSMDREGVPTAFLRGLRGIILDYAHRLVSAEGAAGKWVGEAIENSTDSKAVRDIITKRFGEKVVIADPSDQEGTRLAASRGYTVIPGGAFSAAAWQAIRSAGVKPAGQVTPSPKPFSPDGETLKTVEKVPPRAVHLAAMTVELAAEHAGRDVTVVFTDTPSWKFRAAYTTTGVGGGIVTFNLAALDEEFWGSRAKQWELIIHELGHHAGNHLEEAYHKEICRIAGRALAAFEGCDET